MEGLGFFGMVPGWWSRRRVGHRLIIASLNPTPARLWLRPRGVAWDAVPILMVAYIVIDILQSVTVLSPGKKCRWRSACLTGFQVPSLFKLALTYLRLFKSFLWRMRNMKYYITFQPGPNPGVEKAACRGRPFTVSYCHYPNGYRYGQPATNVVRLRSFTQSNHE
jgi:hypothetical protein